MKKIKYLIPLIFLLVACGSGEDEKQAIQKQEVVKDTQKEEKELLKEKEIPTVEDINAKYDFDVEYSENYKDGKFELKDGGIVYADFNFYLGGKTFDSLSAKFYEDKLVQAQVEKKDGFTVEEVLDELELSKDTEIELSNPKGTMFDIIIDKKFSDDNIKVLPNEWE